MAAATHIFPIPPTSPYSKKMEKNFHAAVSEHLAKSSCYPSFEEIAQTIHSVMAIPTFQHFSSSYQSRRDSMEDAHFHLETQDHIFTGLFDGHGGRDVASFACSYFAGSLPENISHGMDIFLSLNSAFYQIQRRLLGISEWQTQGTTALVCIIEKWSRKIYTATLGDSEAFIFRRFANMHKCIPLSCVRNWSYQKEIRRAEKALPEHCLGAQWDQISDPKFRRLPGKHASINVSRSLGDLDFLDIDSPYPSAISHNPIITETQFMPRDHIILACDGMTDYVSVEEATSIIDRLAIGQSISDPLAFRSLSKHTRFDNDNVTVLGITVLS